MKYVPKIAFIVGLCVLIGMCSHYQHKESMKVTHPPRHRG